MFSVYRKELKLYFRIRSTYIILTVLLVAIGICTAVLAPMGGLQFVPVYLTPLTLGALPLTQIFAERRRRRTNFDEVGFSMGISPICLTVGRFLAALTVFLIPVLLLALLPPLLSMMGTVAYGSAYASVFGYLLLVALLVAMEQAILPLASNMRLGAVLAYVPPVAFYLYQFLMTLFPLGNTILSLLTSINPIGLFYAFTYGRFPIADLVALVTGIALCLTVGVLLCKKRQGDMTIPSRHRIAIILTALALVLTLGLNMGISLIPDSLVNPDVSGSKTFEIVAETKDYLKTLSNDVTVYYLCNGGKKAADMDMQYFLADLAALSPHLQIKVVDSAKETALIQQYGAANLSDQSMVVVCGDRYLLLDKNDLYHYYNADLQVSLSPMQYAYYLNAYTTYLQTQSYGQYDQNAVAYGSQLYASTATVAYFDGCTRLTNAIHYVTSPDAPVVKIFGDKDAMDASLRAYLVSYGYRFTTIDSPTQIGNDCDLLLLHTPKNDITSEEAAALETYLADGGKVFLITSCFYTDMPNLHSVTQKYGLDVMNTKNIVCEEDAQYHYSVERSDYFLAHIAPCDITKTFNGYFAVITAHAINVSENAPEGVTVFPLLYTGEETGCLLFENGEKDTENKDRYVAAAVAQKGDGKLLWLASPDSAGASGYTLSSGGNFTLICESMNWMTDNAYQAVSIPSVAMTSDGLALDANGVTVLAVILAVVLPLAFLIPASVYLYKRKKR